MKILLGTAHPHLPQIMGGAQSSMHELALAFQKLGHDVSTVSGLTGESLFGLKRRVRLKLQKRKWVCDNVLGYPAYRAWFADEVVAEVALHFGADVAMFQSGFPVKMAKGLEGSGIPVAIYLRNVEIDDLGGDLRDLENVRYVANSRFTARRFAVELGIDATVIYPMVEPNKYRTLSSRRNVTFINPHPSKGVDIALGLAEHCPEIPFTFVKAWTLPAEQNELLDRAQAKMSNLTVRPATRDMKSVYSEARIILAPSRWEEAFGRIAAEAHINGIPVVGSDRGGLPEAIGPGGRVISIDAPIEAWASALRELWHSKEAYEAAAAAALLYSRRLEMDAGMQVSRVLNELAAACGQPAVPACEPPYY